MRHHSGFTLFETLLVIALIGLLATLAIPFYQSFQTQAQLDSAIAELKQALRTAQLETMLGKSNVPHGVHIDAQHFIAYQGTSFSPSDPNNFSTTLAPSLHITTSFGADITFSGRQGTPSQTGTISIASSTISHTLSINALGTTGQTN